jgi:hypothetical protein
MVHNPHMSTDNTQPVKKHPGGRPSDYSEEMLAKAQDYLHNFEAQGDVIPSVAGLACWIGCNKQTLYNWAEQNREFFGTLEAIKHKQEVLCLNNGISGVFNSTITKLVLANHGYSEKQEIDHRSGDGSMTPPSTIRIIAEDDRSGD